MKKIKLYCYKGKSSGSIYEYVKVQEQREDAYEFLGTRTIELDEPPKEEPKRIERYMFNDIISPIKFSEGCTKLVELKSNEVIISKDIFNQACNNNDYQCGSASWEERFKELAGFDK
jgi:hypothetical protein